MSPLPIMNWDTPSEPTSQRRHNTLKMLCPNLHIWWVLDEYTYSNLKIHFQGFYWFYFDTLSRTLISLNTSRSLVQHYGDHSMLVRRCHQCLERFWTKSIKDPRVSKLHHIYLTNLLVFLYWSKIYLVASSKMLNKLSKSRLKMVLSQTQPIHMCLAIGSPCT